MSSIADFYTDRTIFITGVTGFMGKVLLEKLLRSCSSLKKVYLLMRPKKGHDIKTRLNQLIESKLFDEVRQSMSDIGAKVIPVAGDILEPKLGLSEEDERRLMNEVSVVFHSAATVRFDEPLKISVQLNVIGVKRILDLCKRMRHLEALVHISTAYANCDRRLILEQVYQPPITAAKIISAMEWMDDDVLQTLTPKIIHPRPNTYTFTKAIAEHLILEQSKTLPVVIVRPSIVGASWQEPIQGWVDNFNGPSGLLVAIGKGVLRVMMGNNRATADIIPVDMAVNLIVVAAWSAATFKHDQLQVFNCVTGHQNKLTWGQLEHASLDCFSRYPVDVPVRLPDPKFTQNKTYYVLHRWFDHFLPAWLMDIGLKLCGQKPMLVRLQRRLWKSVTCLEFFTSHEWKFEDSNVKKLYEMLGEVDQKEFNFDVKKINWQVYMENYCLGVKKFVLKEDMRNVVKARKALNRLVLRNRLKYLLTFVGISLFLYFSRFSGKFLTFNFTIASAVYKLVATILQLLLWLRPRFTL